MGMNSQVYVGAFLAVSGLKASIANLGNESDELDALLITKHFAEGATAMIPNLSGRQLTGHLFDMEELPTFADPYCPCCAKRNIEAFELDYEDQIALVAKHSEQSKVVFGTLGFVT